MKYEQTLTFVNDVFETIEKYIYIFTSYKITHVDLVLAEWQLACKLVCQYTCRCPDDQ